MMAVTLALAVSCAQHKAPKILVLYYSQTGNTKAVAEQLQTRLGADIEAIVPVVPYDGDFKATIDRSINEREEGSYPEIQPLASNLKDYDIVFLGYPVWFGTFAPPVSAMLASVDLSGKKIVPFCTFGSGGLDSSINDLKTKAPGAEILPGYGVRAARMDAVPAELDRFLIRGGFVEGECPELEEFPEAHEVSEEESAIFDAAVGDYPMMHAKAVEVASRAVPEGTEYLFAAKDEPRGDAPSGDMPPAGTIKVYVLAADGQTPVFTQVVRLPMDR